VTARLLVSGATIAAYTRYVIKRSTLSSSASCCRKNPSANVAKNLLLFLANIPFCAENIFGSDSSERWPRPAKDHQWTRHGGQPAAKHELEFQEHYPAGAPDGRGLGIHGKHFGDHGEEPDRSLAAGSDVAMAPGLPGALYFAGF
jgi:hypothetical protein